MTCSCSGSQSSKSLKKVTHVLFDMDGLILDTEKLYTQGVQNIVSCYGKTYTFDMKVQIMAAPALVAAQKLIDMMELPFQPEELDKLLREQYKALMQHPGFMPGIERFIHHLHKHNVPIALATTSTQTSFDMKTQDHKEFFKLFDHLVLGGSDPDVKNGKPHPDIFLVCASRFPDKPKPDKCLVLEDSPNGVTAAIAAGMQCLMIPDERMKPEFQKQATLVVRSAEEIKPELFGLPPF